MTSPRPNVLLLTVDTWRADRLSVYGYPRPTTPRLETFAQNAMVCDSAFTLGPFTQIAFLQLLTSSRPFNYGGYDSGAVGRPDTLFKRFHDAGYHTSGLSTIHWVSPHYGYTEGLDSDTGIFLLNTLVGMAVINMRDTLSVYQAGNIAEHDMLAIATPVIRKLFRNVHDYCDTWIENGRALRSDFPDSRAVNDGYDYCKVKRVAERHSIEFESNPVAYIHRHLRETPKAHEWLARDWHYCRTPGKLIKEAGFRLTNRVVKSVNPRLAGMRANRFRLSADAHSIATKVIGQLHDRDTDKPFFIWAHFKDTHQPFVSGPGRKWYRHTPDYLESLGYSRNINPAAVFSTKRPQTEDDWATVSALYDAAVRSTDEAMGNILDTLERLGLAENTVVGICGDHGEEIGEHGDYGHQCMHYEHNSRVPLLFRFGNDAGKRNDSLVTHLDWAPSLAEAAGIDPAPGWEGQPVTSGTVAERDHIVMETFCRGNCAFAYRPLYMGVRTQRHKYIWKEYQDPTHKAGSPEPELYDLEADPDEHNNLYREDHPLVGPFNALIAERLAQIPEVTPERIAAAFGPKIAEDIRQAGAKGENVAAGSD